MGGDSKLLQRARRFWYNNAPGPFVLGKETITRQQIDTYGGPGPELNGCADCQTMEWLSRVFQENRHEPHMCPTGTQDLCVEYSRMQGDDLWTPYHRNYWGFNGYDDGLNTAHGLVLFRKEPSGSRLYSRYWSHNCDVLTLEMKKQFAGACQMDVLCHDEVNVSKITWDKYDFLIVPSKGQASWGTFRPPIPIIMHTGDVNHGGHQAAMDSLRPDMLWTTGPTCWKNAFNIGGAKIAFVPRMVSNFFTRPNLCDDLKQFDLLNVGAIGHHIYRVRTQLHNQLKSLVGGRHRIGFSNRFGWRGGYHRGPVQYQPKGDSKPINYLNKWSEFLGTARYVAFGPMCGIATGGFPVKHAECVGSGAIAIMPQLKDSDAVGLEPMVHYIPVSQIQRNNARVVELLDNYSKYKHIAENGVKWHQENVDQLRFGRFEDMIQDITGHKYPRRLL